MTPLQRIELRVLQLLPSLNLRPTLDRSAEVGELLSEAKAVVPYGEWANWLRRVGLSPRTARTHMQVCRHFEERPATANLTIEQFLACLRQSRIAGRREERDAARAEVAARLGRLPESIRLIHSACQDYLWPVNVQAIVSDPPWKCLDDYRWLASMAMRCLADDGVMLVQTGTLYLPAVMRIMQDAGLVYNWTLSIVYAEFRGAKPTGSQFLSAWKPVLYYSRCPLTKASEYIGDVYTVRNASSEKNLHDWSQPAEPFVYWLARLVRPGGLVLDPFAGSGTTGSVCRSLGLRWIGTEIDEGAYQVARGRLLAEVEKPVAAGV